MSIKLEEACKLLKEIEVVKDEREEKEGRVTKTFLRKVFELLEEADSKEEYIVSVGYMVARRRKEDKKEDDTLKFFRRLKGLVETKQGDWSKVRGELKGVLEYTIKLYHIKADLGEDLCTRL